MPSIDTFNYLNLGPHEIRLGDDLGTSKGQFRSRISYCNYITQATSFVCFSRKSQMIGPMSHDNWMRTTYWRSNESEQHRIVASHNISEWFPGYLPQIIISFHLPGKHWNKGPAQKIMPLRRFLCAVWHPWIFWESRHQGLRDPLRTKNPRVFFPGLPGGYWMTQALAMSNAHHLTTDVKLKATGVPS